MPKGSNPNSRKNLEKGKKYQFNAETASEMGKRGAPKSNANQAETKRQKLIIREILEEAIKQPYKDEETGEELPRLVIGLNKMTKRFAKMGGYSDLEAISEHLGQKPAQKVEQLVITPEVDYDKLKDLRKALKDDE